MKREIMYGLARENRLKKGKTRNKKYKVRNLRMVIYKKLRKYLR